MASLSVIGRVERFMLAAERGTATAVPEANTINRGTVALSAMLSRL
jgi:hypothetical protein